MRVALIGGTGFVGSYILDSLSEAGHEVALLVREGSGDKVRGGAKVQTVSGDIGDPASLLEVTASCDAAIYCVGILRERPSKGITFESAQYDGVIRCLAAATTNKVRRFLLMSANGAQVPGTAYQETKKRAEDAAFESGLNVTVFRPSVIFGNPRGRMEFATQLYRDMVKPPIPAVGFFSGLNPRTGAVLMSPIHVEDVAKAFSIALMDEMTAGRIYELGGPEVLSWSEMIHRIAMAAGRSKWIIPMPIALMKFAATVFDWLPFFPVTRDQLTMLAQGNTADSGVVETLIGQPPVAFSPDKIRYLAR